jgi:hypothetical protein
MGGGLGTAFRARAPGGAAAAIGLAASGDQFMTMVHPIRVVCIAAQRIGCPLHDALLKEIWEYCVPPKCEHCAVDPSASLCSRCRRQFCAVCSAFVLALDKEDGTQVCIGGQAFVCMGHFALPRPDKLHRSSDREVRERRRRNSLMFDCRSQVQ